MNQETPLKKKQFLSSVFFYFYTYLPSLRNKMLFFLFALKCFSSYPVYHFNSMTVCNTHLSSCCMKVNGGNVPWVILNLQGYYSMEKYLQTSVKAREKLENSPVFKSD